jgi:hypothetical protein
MSFRCSPARADAGGLPRELPTGGHLYEPKRDKDYNIIWSSSNA